MVHTFLIDYGYRNEEGVMCRSSDYYKISVEGDLTEAEEALQLYSFDVKYLSSRNRGKHDTGKRSLTETLQIVSCKFVYSLRPKWNKPGLNQKQMPVDSRHEVFHG